MRIVLASLFAAGLLAACDPTPPVTVHDAGTARDGGGPTECPPGQTFCNGRCIPTATNPLHCGACGNVCEADETCEDGACRGVTSCPAGQSDCGGGCTDVSTNPAHCGRCGEVCGEGVSCRSGSCEPDTCPAEAPERCGDGCTNPQTDASNCGACGTKCGADESCVAGTCTSSCDSTSCEVDGANVCVDSTTDVEHCGGCNMPCGAGEGCSGGACACPSGTMDCGGSCVNTQTDPANCGACGAACPASSACVGGACQCPTGLTRCGGTCVNTAIDAAHCGGCEMACGGGETCAGSTCESACAGGLTMCGASCVNTSSDAAHCGMCGNACADGAGCAAGRCRPSNDERASATEITLSADGGELTERGSTDGATPDLPTVTCDANGPNVWYRVSVPAGGGVLWVDTAGSGYDTAVFVTNEAGTQVSGMCNDDCGCEDTGDFGLLESCAARYLDAGTYYISVGGYSVDATGDFTLHVQFLPDTGFTYRTRLNATGTTFRTVLLDTSEASASCGGSGTALSGEDMRWFASCGAGEVHHLSLCPEDGGLWTRMNASGDTYDPVMSVESARDGMEAVCSDDDFSVNCQPEGGGPRFGSRIRDFAAGRGVHGVIIDSRGLAGGGMEYQMRYELPDLSL